MASTRRTSMGKTVFAALTGALLCAPMLRATTISVNSTADTVPADDGICTLREAIVAANTDTPSGVTAGECSAGAGADTLDLTGVSGTITLTSALPSLTTDMAIAGPGAANLTISGNDLYRVFFVTNGATVSISDLTIAHGKSVGGAGGAGLTRAGGGAAGVGAGLLVNSGTVALTGVTFDSNSVTGGAGGAAVCHGPPGSGGGGGGVDGNTGGIGGPDGGDGGAGGAFGGAGGTGAEAGDCENHFDTASGGGEGAGGGGGAGCETAVPADHGAFGGIFGGGGGGFFLALGGFGGFGGGGGGGRGTSPNGGTFGGSGGQFFPPGSRAAAGGGGAGMGAALFLRTGATVTVSSCAFSKNSASGGSGGSVECAGASGDAGKGKGGAIFVMDGATLTAICPTSDLTFSGDIASDAGSTRSNPQDNNDVYGTVTSLDTTNPVITCPADHLNVPNDAGLCSATVDPGTATAIDDCEVASIQGVRSDSPAALNDPYPVGTTTITWTAAGTAGTPDQCTQTITVVDSEKPVVTSSIAVGVLANDHTMKNVGYVVSASDACSGAILPTVQVFGSEDDQTPTGDGMFSPDAKNIGPSGTLRLRQERVNNGPGRVYLIVAKATDGSSNTGFSCKTVVSPRSSKVADINKVQSLATTAKNYCQAHSGNSPAGYFVVGDGPVIGPKQ